MSERHRPRRKLNRDEEKARGLLASSRPMGEGAVSGDTEHQLVRVLRRIDDGETVHDATTHRVAAARLIGRPGIAVASVATVVALGIGVVMSTGISGEDGSEGQPVSTGLSDSGIDWEAIDVELVHMVDQNANRTLHDAHEQLIVECMQNEGFERWPEPFDGGHPWNGGVVVVPDNTPYDLSMDDASMNGYAPASNEPGRDAREDSPNREYIESLDPSESETYHEAALGSLPSEVDFIIVEHPDGSGTGIAPDGCFSQARQQLFGDLATYMSLAYVVHNAEHLATTRARSAPAVSERVEDWVVCMSEAGYRGIGDPEQAIQDTLAARIEGEQAFESEVAQAEAHAECLSDSGLSTAFALEYEQALADLQVEHHSALREFEAIQVDAVEEARRVLADGEAGSA